MLKKRIILGLIGALLAVVFVGCSKEAKPEDALTNYATKWEAGKYDEMYDLLSTEGKKSISKEDFVKKYTNIFSGIEAHNVKIKVTDETAKDSDEFGYDVKMDTYIGPLAFSNKAKLVKEGEKSEAKWVVDWNPSLILPDMAQGDTVKVETTKPARGQILDRNKQGLAINEPTSQIGVVPGKLSDDRTQLAAVFGMSVDDVNKTLSAKWIKDDSFVPLIVLPLGETPDKYIAVPGVTTKKTIARTYPLKDASAHLIGYVGEVTSEELEKDKDKVYSAGDIIGKSGLEQVHDKELRGELGGKISIVDANKKMKKVVLEREAKNGEDIQLTIDATVQRALYNEIKDEKSSTSAMNPKTGEVLALVSSPSYDPNMFIRGAVKGVEAGLLKDPKNPMLNRFAATYAPGSTFKTTTAAIAMEASKLDPNENVSISGLKWQKDSSWKTDYITRVHDTSVVNLNTAFIFSDNIYFAQNAIATGTKAYEDGAKKFGFGDKFVFDYPIQSSQLSKDGIKNEKALGDTGYGQGEMLMSTLHLAQTFTPYLNDGDMITPVLIKKDVTKTNAMKKETASTILAGLINVVNDPNGTGKAAKIDGKDIAGKTGTAELKKSATDDGQENGLFVGFSVKQPDLLISMLIEDVKGRGGSSIPAAKVKNVLNQFLK